LIPNGILVVWPKSVKLKEYAFLTTGVQLKTATFYLCKLAKDIFL